MKTLRILLSILAALITLALAASARLQDEPAGLSLALAILLLLLPLRWSRLKKPLGPLAPHWGRALVVLVLLISLIRIVLFSERGNTYRTPGDQQVLEALSQQDIDRLKGVWEEEWIGIDGAKMHLLQSGPEDAPPLLVIPAPGMGLASWEGLLDSLSQKYRTLVLLLPGGAAMLPDNTSDIAGILSGLLEGQGIDSAALVAESYGGLMALCLAVHSPDKVRALALASPIGLRPLHGKTILLSRLSERFPLPVISRYATDHFLGEGLLQDTVRAGRLGTLLTRTHNAWPGYPAFSRQHLASVSMPSLVFLATEDHMLGKVDYAQRVVRRIPDLRLRILESGHLVSLEKHEEVREQVLEFLGRVYPPGRQGL